MVLYFAWHHRFMLDQSKHPSVQTIAFDKMSTLLYVVIVIK